MTRRREFLRQVAGVTALSFSAKPSPVSSGRVAIVLDQRDSVAASAQVKWAAGELQQAIKLKGADSVIAGSPAEAGDAAFYVGLGHALPDSKGPEALSLNPGKLNGRSAILVSGSDTRGFVFGLLELADRVRFSSDVESGLTLNAPVTEQPANQVRSIARAFCSEIEDKTWYYDKDFWRTYLTTLATHRFNRFNLTFGLGYDFPRGVTGDYFHFPYPYLFDVPGYRVRVLPLSDSERDRNFEMLRFIAAETAARGLHFQLGIWTHAYQWTDSPHSHHHIEGLTAETHAPYCRDALALLLKTCPEIQGLTLRVHGESGIPEGSYEFWRTVFEGITRANRQIEIDMHAKGVDETMIGIAVQTGMPVKLSPKFWAEHMGLAYHQADIRELEIPRPGRMEQGVFNLSNGSRRFLRYGYGDLFQEGRRYDLLFRLWPGTQRTLVWGDPAIAAGYGRASHFCDAAGIDICEPLFFKGREGSGIAGDRCAYADKSLSPKYDWEKFEYTYRVWGRLLYNPDADPQSWRRYLAAKFGLGAESLEAAVANGSRVLPILTTAHLPSASNHSFWPEIYANMPIVPGSEPSPYSDTPEPKRFGTVSPLDPELFSSINEYVKELLDGQQSRKYSPMEAAQWLEDCATRSNEALNAALKTAHSARTPEFRRIQEDVELEAGVGRFFSSKLRSGVLFEIFLETGDRAAGEQALSEYRNARQAWASLAERAKGVYLPDITYGETPNRRGHWMDRLPAIDADLAAMEVAIGRPVKLSAPANRNVADVIRSARARTQRLQANCTHQPPASFEPGESLSLSLLFTEISSQPMPSSARLHYRHVNHAERWQFLEMEHATGSYAAAIPANYTKSIFPLQYYFEIRHSANSVSMYPGLNADLANEPYFVVMQA
ncbi:MAG: hypothetical protein WB676_19925 [Bryobacteraceae bacterium]